MVEENTEQAFALCTENKDCEDLEKGKIYQVLPDGDEKKKVISGSLTNQVKIIPIPNPISSLSNFPMRCKKHCE